ncbi:MAG: hypothetical protein JJT76_07880 [Clostridiaceae bacterium]|nr:hypothetical protein [Clostridiaceae bacterium]
MESIIIFVIFAIVSSLFSKDKKGKGPTKRTPPQHPSQTQQPPRLQKTTTRNAGRFGDLLKDLKGDFEEVFKEGQQTQQQQQQTQQTPSTHQQYNEYENQYGYVEEEHIEKTYETDKPKTQEKKDTVKGSIYEGEIGGEMHPGKLSFDQQSLVKGIIMAEVLGKPKSMKR